ncbi:MAG TPA: NADPH:quinone reductase [Terriglobales bacterium]|nr:NADPH:quinone reductase [Terriglobales bacterium]
MQAIAVQEFGGPEVLHLVEVEKPVPGPEDVLIAVKAAGVNPYDTYMRSGTYAIKPELPYTPGSDAAGIVEKVGANVTRLKPGDRVYAEVRTGAYAQFALAHQDQAHALPDNITFAQGAGIWVPYGTAYHALVQAARVRAGETVLIHGASGGVGTAAAQLARSLGLTVVGTAGSPAGLELARRAGAAQVFDHSTPGHLDQLLAATGGRGFDLILEMLANVNLGHDLKLLAPRGRVVVIGSRGEVTLNPRDLMSRRASVLAFTLWATTPEEKREIHAGLNAGLRDGTLQPLVGREFPLAAAADAHRQVMAPGAQGKIVLIP